MAACNSQSLRTVSGASVSRTAMGAATVSRVCIRGVVRCSSGPRPTTTTVNKISAAAIAAPTSRRLCPGGGNWIWVVSVWFIAGSFAGVGEGVAQCVYIRSSSPATSEVAVDL